MVRLSRLPSNVSCSVVSLFAFRTVRTAVRALNTAATTAAMTAAISPLIRHLGQYCYVAALLPGHREPAPILRLRYQGSADRWAIAIYKASSGQYTESELPG